ncbi:hypothetical protein ES703_31230 [subsurface metagenome]
MVKQKKGKKEKKIIPSKTNSKVEEIIEDYPQKLTAYPRESFEEQLRNHLTKHKIK